MLSHERPFKSVVKAEFEKTTEGFESTLETLAVLQASQRRHEKEFELLKDLLLLLAGGATPTAMKEAISSHAAVQTLDHGVRAAAAPVVVSAAAPAVLPVSPIQGTAIRAQGSSGRMERSVTVESEVHAFIARCMQEVTMRQHIIYGNILVMATY